MTQLFTGKHVLMDTLVAEGVGFIFGNPGSMFRWMGRTSNEQTWDNPSLTGQSADFRPWMIPFNEHALHVR